MAAGHGAVQLQHRDQRLGRGPAAGPGGPSDADRDLPAAPGVRDVGRPGQRAAVPPADAGATTGPGTSETPRPTTSSSARARRRPGGGPASPSTSTTSSRRTSTSRPSTGTWPAGCIGRATGSTSRRRRPTCGWAARSSCTATARPARTATRSAASTPTRPRSSSCCAGSTRRPPGHRDGPALGDLRLGRCGCCPDALAVRRAPAALVPRAARGARAGGRTPKARPARRTPACCDCAGGPGVARIIVARQRVRRLARADSSQRTRPRRVGRAARPARPGRRPDGGPRCPVRRPAARAAGGAPARAFGRRALPTRSRPSSARSSASRSRSPARGRCSAGSSRRTGSSRCRTGWPEPGLTHAFPTAAALAAADPETLPMPRARGRSVVAVARAVLDQGESLASGRAGDPGCSAGAARGRAVDRVVPRAAGRP